MVEGIAILATSTWREALAVGAQILHSADDESAAGDARRLLLHALDVDAVEFIKQPDMRLTPRQADAFADMLVRRQRTGEPIARIVGMRGFYGRDFKITPATLDPRPETETLIETALDVLSPAHPGGSGLNILDIGTGSGCLLGTLLAEWPSAHGTGIDPSTAALAVAAVNAKRLGVSDRCTWVEGREFGTLRGRFQLIVCNPPYIRAADIAGLARDVRDHDPVLALDGGADGLDIYRAIARGLAAHIADGWVLFEAGFGQAADISGIITAALPRGVIRRSKIVDDMAGTQRCVAFEIRS